jgi:DNA-directed RNA polymerase omega subunit
LKGYGDLESKFRFVILASKRAKQLLRGAKPKIKTKSKNLIRIAQQEVERGVINYELVERTAEDVEVVEEDMFIGEDIDGPGLDLGESFSVEDLKKTLSKESPEEEAIRRAVLEAVKESEGDDGDDEEEDEEGEEEDKEEEGDDSEGEDSDEDLDEESETEKD